MTLLLIGTDKADITPATPLPLAGFTHRVGEYEGVAAEIYARTLVMETIDSRTNESDIAILVSADLLGWGEESAATMSRQCESRFGVKKERCIFHATHSHSGPQTSIKLEALLGLLNPDYLAWLEEQVLKSIERALAKREEVTMEKGVGECSIGIHRRKMVGGSMVMAPNPDEAIDRDVTVIRFMTRQHYPKAFLVHYTCHPTTSDHNKISSEFPGAAMSLLEEEWEPDVIALFLQGFCGDVRPNLVKDGEFCRGTQTEIDMFGKQLADAVTSVLTSPMQAIHAQPIRETSRVVQLHYHHSPSFVELRVNLLQISDQLSFLAASGELVSEYGLWVKRRSEGTVLSLGYCNGLLGYIPTARQISEGGYESMDSFPFFGLEGPFADHVESIVYSELEDMFRISML
ncbi:neutral/alkaline non-lysosomal ceramidase N-terminal domain-containing protein [Paenibacillus chungangensis]|uniref:Neutral/alkaline non-lysosomal ceramidase N-terminal domain-containing protein n=1 Tax=Paenibacillus chungangensis TaxID=696535 RepID=A0ABW3HLL8_9BACL